MPRLLLTGMSSTGKSTLLAALARRGWQTVDTDEDGWSVERLANDGSTEQVWREDAIAALLSEPVERVLVVSGCVSNQGRFYDRFDAVVLLSVPVEVVVERLATRDTNRFGKDPAELARVLADIATVEPLLRATCSVELDGRRPVDELVAEMQRITAAVPPGTRPYSK